GPAATPPRSLHLRRLILSMADSRPPFPRHDRSATLCADELDHGARRRLVLGAGARSAAEAAGENLLRHAHGTCLWRDVPANHPRRDHYLHAARPLPLLRAVRPALSVGERAQRSALRRPHHVDSAV